MSDHIILCITEGGRRKKGINEVSLIEKYLAPQYLSDDNIEIVSYGTNIYELFRELDNDDFLDTYSVLQGIVKDKENNPLKYERDEIAEIYLFFDLDAHATQTSLVPEGVDGVQQVIDIFDNANENGLIYISYPMFEAYKHPINSVAVVDIFIKGGYKKYVPKICDSKFAQLPNFTKEEWNHELKNHFLNINDFLYGSFVLPNEYDTEQFTQTAIYQKQLKEHIIPNQQVRVISPFCLFLLDYLGNPLLKTWQ